MVKLTYLSHSAFIIDNDNYKILIDPFISGNPTCPVKASSLSADYIILSHAHGDHLGDTLTIAKRNNSEVIAVNELARYIASHGIRMHNMHIGGAFNFPFGRVKFTIAHHGSAIDDESGKYMGEPAGIIINIDGKTIYHCGDTGLFYDMKLIGEMNKIDVMLAPIGDNFTMGIDDAVKAVELVNPSLAIPIHYNTFPVIQADPNEFVSKILVNGKNARILNYGETIVL